LNSKFLKLDFEVRAHSTVITRVIRSDAKEFVVELIFTQDFKDSGCQVFSRNVTVKTFKSKNVLLESKVLLDPMSGNAYSLADVGVKRESD
jgi:hypothetical protein